MRQLTIDGSLRAMQIICSHNDRSHSMSKNPKSALSELMNNAHFQRAFNAIKHGSIQDIIPFQDIWIYEDGTLKVSIDFKKKKKLLILYL